MADYTLYCFAQSGNAYKVALMLTLVGAKWSPIFVDFFKGETRTPEYRTNVNEMGEVPVLVDGERKLSQSGAILNLLMERFGQFGPRGEHERYEIWRWILFDNHKISNFLATYRFMKTLAKIGDPIVHKYLNGRIKSNLKILDKHFDASPFAVGSHPTIADISLCGYMLFPADEYDFDIASENPAIGAWLDRLRALPKWQPPYDLMPDQAIAP